MKIEIAGAFAGILKTQFRPIIGTLTVCILHFLNLLVNTKKH